MFAEMPLDNRTVGKFTLLAAAFGWLGHLGRDRRETN
jgi:hypothetical protein